MNIQRTGTCNWKFPANTIKAHTMTKEEMGVKLSIVRSWYIDITDWRSTRTGRLSSEPKKPVSKLCLWPFPGTQQEAHAQSTHIEESKQWHTNHYTQADCAAHGMYRWTGSIPSSVAAHVESTVKLTNSHFPINWLEIIQSIGRGNRAPLGTETNPWLR